MGLQKHLTREDTKYQYEFPNAYFKIIKVDLNTMTNKLKIIVRAYADYEARTRDPMIEGLPFLNTSCKLFENTYNIDFVMISNDNEEETIPDKLLKAAYSWLKTQSGKFSDAIDIL